MPTRLAAYLTAACLTAAWLIAACSAGGQPAGAGPGHRGVSTGIARAGPARVFGQAPAGHGGVAVTINGPGPAGGFLVVPGLSGPSKGRPHITVPPIPPAGSGRPVNLPLSTYEDVDSQQQAALADASALLTQKCMRQRGFSYSPQASPALEEALVQATEYGYGVSSLAVAGTFGYGQPGPGAGQGPGPAFLGGFASFGDLARQPRAWIVALLGFAPGARTGSHQPEGCLQLSGQLLYGQGTSPADPVPAIAIQASQWTQTDPRVLAVDAAWSRCMARKGYRYRNPQQAAGAHWPSTPSALEIATAVADVSCKRQVNLVNTWLTVEAAYQAALIGTDLATLADLQASFGTLLRRAESLLALPALPAGRLPPGKGRPGLRIRIQSPA